MRKHRADLSILARRAMRERGLEPDFPPDVLDAVDRMEESEEADQKDGERTRGGSEGGSEGGSKEGSPFPDLRSLPWMSIDNDDSRDLDQLNVAEDLGDGRVRVHVAIADVDSRVKKDDPIDRHARWNTTSVYTPAIIFPMLPERLSTDLTSLNENRDRLAVVVSFVVLEDGSLGAWDVRRARVRNHAKLAYNAVSAWLDGEGKIPEPMAALEGAGEQIRLQDRIAARLRERRIEHGALDLETVEARTVVRNGEVIDFRWAPQNRAQRLIEDVMIAANGVTTAFLEARRFPTFRRIVRSPERWSRIAQLARGYGWQLPPSPDSRSLARFLEERRREDPVRFPDLSLAIVKLLGSGEYAAQMPGQPSIGHFGLAVRDYSHSTAPNRRYPDLITQRLLKAAMRDGRSPYREEELRELAAHCTEQEDTARKVERQIDKSAAALFLADRIGDRFAAIVTGVSPKGTWVRMIDLPVEGKLVSGRDSFDVGDALTVTLVDTDVERGYIDFTA